MIGTLVSEHTYLCQMTGAQKTLNSCEDFQDDFRAILEEKDDSMRRAHTLTDASQTKQISMLRPLR